MAPEQASGQSNLDARVDIYALGLILYEALTGTRPFPGDSYLGILAKQINESPEKPSERCPDLAAHPDLAALILRALAKEPDDRYSSMRAFGAAILESLESVDPREATAIRPVRLETDPGDEPSTGALGPDSMAPATVRAASRQGAPARRRLLIAGVAAGSVVALISLLAFSSLRSGDDENGSGEGGAALSASELGVANPPATEKAEPESRPDLAPERSPTEETEAEVAPTVRLHSAAAGAVAFSPDGERLGPLPLQLSRPVGDNITSIVVRAKGFAPAEVAIAGDSGDDLDIALKRKRTSGKQRRTRQDDDISRTW